MSTIDYISAKWNTLASAFTQRQELIAKCLQEIISAYSSPKRYYHNLSHIESMLRLSDEYVDALTDKHVVDLAIFYHDYIYKVPGSNNEHESAVLAEKRLKELTVPDEKIRQVVSFIEATKTHVVPPGAESADLHLFLDFDMMILAADWEEYERYTKNIRREYKFYPTFMYRNGRNDFLKKTLASEHIFHSDAFRSAMEEKARANISRELNKS